MSHFRVVGSMTLRVVIAAGLFVACGCASSGADAGDTVASMSAFGNSTAKAKDSIDAAVKALETLTSSQAGDIKANLDAFSKTVAALEGQAATVRANADEMRATGNEFFKSWEGSANVTPERRAQLTASYERIKQQMAAAKDAFTPFMASLKDIQSYVSLDPTLTGISSMSGLVDTAKSTSTEVKSRLDAVLNEVNSVRGMLSTASKD